MGEKYGKYRTRRVINSFKNGGKTPGAVFTNIPNLSPILVIKFMTFVLVKIGPNLVFTKHVLARTIFLILS